MPKRKLGQDRLFITQRINSRTVLISHLTFLQTQQPNNSRQRTRCCRYRITHYRMHMNTTG